MNQVAKAVILKAVYRVIDRKLIGVTIDFGDEQMFISHRQDVWPGVQEGEFPDPAISFAQWLAFPLIEFQVKD